MGKIDIRPACLRDASFLTAHMRQADVDEIMCQLSPETKRHELAYGLVMSHGSESFIAYYDDVPALIIGTTPMNVACVSAWALGTKNVWRVIIPATRHFISQHVPMRVAEGFRTMEARSHVAHDQAHRWMRSTGAVVCDEPFVYGRDGEKFLTFRWALDALPAAQARYKVQP